MGWPPGGRNSRSGLFPGGVGGRLRRGLLVCVGDAAGGQVQGVLIPLRVGVGVRPALGGAPRCGCPGFTTASEWSGKGRHPQRGVSGDSRERLTF